MLRRERSQTASDNRHRPKFGPGCIHYVGGSGVLLADEPVFTIATLQVVLCAGDGHLHRALGAASVTVQVAAGAPGHPGFGANCCPGPANLDLTEAAEAAGGSPGSQLRCWEERSPELEKGSTRAGFSSLSALPL